MESKFEFDMWLVEILERNIWNIKLKDDFREVTIPINLPGLFYSKVDVGDLDKISFLENLGFNLVETNVQFEREANPSLCFGIHKEDEMRFVKELDSQAVKSIAWDSFLYSRFHLDPMISNELANKIKAEWAENYFHGKRGDKMIVAVVNGEVVGFLLLLYKNTREEEFVFIDLIAVKEEFRSQRIAQSMMAFIAYNYGPTKIRAGTQIVNTPSVRFYEKNGFRMVGASYTFHLHKGENKCAV